MNTKIKLYYFTDPLCSHCWALDYNLTRFKLEYHHHLEIITVMGGMVEDGNHFADLHGKEATEQAEHWEQVGLFYRIPIYKDIWHENPITSSFPSSIAFLAIKEKHPHLAAKFLRLVREGAFAFGKNIADREVLSDMIASLGVDTGEILELSYSEAGKLLLQENYRPMLEFGITGFPTVIMVNEKNEGIKITGARSYDTYKKALVKLVGEEQKLVLAPTPSLRELLEQVPTMFYNDIAKTYDIAEESVGEFVVDQLGKQGYQTGAVGQYKYVRLSRAN